MAAIQERHAILYGAPAMAFFRCPVCRGDTHAFANARAAAYCPVCLRDHNPVVVLVPCGHAYCVGCMEVMLDHHGGEAVIDMRPLAPQALVAEEEIMFDGGLIAGVEDYQPPPPNYGDAASVGSDDTQFDEENEAMLVEVDAVTLPLPGAPPAKALPRPGGPQRPQHPPPPTPVADIVRPTWASASAWDFAWQWQGELCAWVFDHRHQEHTLVNPITWTFVTAGSFVVAPPTPHLYLVFLRDVGARYNRRWTLVPR